MRTGRKDIRHPPQWAGGGVSVRLEDVSKRYGAHEVVRGVSLEAHPGECLALLGPNGAGKTTLFKLMLGLVQPGSGHVTLERSGPAASEGRPVREKIGFLPENVAFYDAMTGAEVLAFYARLKGASLPGCALLLERVGLGEAASKTVRTYSKGMRQRLGLAQALLGDPELLVLDEPTSGLDPALRRDFLEIIATLKAAGVTIIISTHALTEIEAHADRFAIIERGSIVASGTLPELRRRAGLPVRIRLSLAPGAVAALIRGIGGRKPPLRVCDGTLEFSCSEAEKMALIRKIARLDIPIDDLSIRTPRLDDIYAHFTTGEAAQ
ncbi:putative ABC transporter ATP-binding protein YxlF [bacterium BMS3Bbin10]|nr:putative ABC transporter ATP-binding protein YxlF [bacterium BMS3Bbin10]HDL16301.1 ABC transporter ATP-binding protein [Hyphomicrobiales bacterium]